MLNRRQSVRRESLHAASWLAEMEEVCSCLALRFGSACALSLVPGAALGLVPGAALGSAAPAW